MTVSLTAGLYANVILPVAATPAAPPVSVPGLAISGMAPGAGLPETNTTWVKLSVMVAPTPGCIEKVICPEARRPVIVSPSAAGRVAMGLSVNQAPHLSM